MNNSIIRTFSLAASMVLGFTSSLPAAQQATFHLPVTAHWGTVVLKPGDYKMLMPDESLGERQFQVQGADKTVYVLPMVTDIRSPSHSSHFELAEINGEYFIRSLACGSLSKQFTFYTPKVKRHLEVAQRRPIGSDSLNVSVN